MENIYAVDLYRRALYIDSLKKINLPSTKRILYILRDYNPKYIGRGTNKRIFKVTINRKIRVFKVGNLKDDYVHYKKLKYCKYPYAKIFWQTKHCQLQRYGTPVNISDEKLKELKAYYKEKGFDDVRRDNLKMVYGKINAIDLWTIEGKK